MVSRILVTVHQAVDDAFPEVRPAPHRFAKTVFGDEPTINQMMPGTAADSTHQMSEDTLRDVSERLNQPKQLLLADDVPLVSDQDTSRPDDEEAQNLGSTRQKKMRQTIIGCALLLLALMLGYLFW
jgi:hypothetical protein